MRSVGAGRASLPSFGRSVIPISVSRALPSDRVRELALAGALVLWLAYTRVYWILHAAHLPSPVCPFYYFTGHPCPFCGGTRSFAYMWNGDLSDSVRLFPLGPALFAGTFAAVGALVFGAISGRTLRPRFTREQWKGIAAGLVVTVLISWALKVFVLGN